MSTAVSRNPRVIAMPSSAEATGAIVWWILSGSVLLEALRRVWLQAGFDPADLPGAPTPKAALRRALKGLENKQRFARPCGDGWALVTQWEGTPDEAGHKAPEFAPLLEAWVNAAGIVEVKGGPEELGNKIKADYALEASQLSTEEVSNWLVKRAEVLSAVGLRDRGGLYFVPAGSLARWHAEAVVLRQASGHTLCEVPAMASDEAVAAILDAVQREAEAEALAMEEQLTGGSLGARALATRINRTEAVEKKVSLYEGLLGSKLDALRARLSSLRANLAAAMLSGGEEG